MVTRRTLVVCLAVGLLMIGVDASAQRSKGRVAPSQDEGAWYPLSVTGGQFALDALGLPVSLDRASVMTELVRRLHFGVSAVDLEAKVLELSLANADLANLRNAIALGSPSDKPLTLDMARQGRSRKLLQAALQASGLRLRKAKKQYTIEDAGGDDAARLRARLRYLGVDAADLRQRMSNGEGLTLDVPAVTIPLPLSPQTWGRVVFERDVPARELFVAIVREPAARMLYHGLIGLDADTRRWLGTQDELLRHFYRNPEAVSAFALFGPALHIAAGRVVVPGGPLGAQRWSALLDADVARPDRFVRRLFDRDGGRVAGLYFNIASVDEARQAFILGKDATDGNGDERFRHLASSFASCYPSSSTAYPFAVRQYDPALFLLEVDVTPEGKLAGPRWRRFWTRALDGDDLPQEPARDLRDLAEDGAIDAAWLVDAVCDPPAPARQGVFETLLFGHRTFAGVPDAELPDALIAVRARRLYPATMMALEQSGVRRPSTYAAIARHAERIGRVGDPTRAITALRQFQGALALTVGAIGAQTLDADAGGRLLESLAAVPFDDERYQGQLAGWLTHEWLPAVRRSVPSTQSPTGAEHTVIGALSGAVANDHPPIVWEGSRYLLDISGSAGRRLRDVRARQGGLTLDSVLALDALSRALGQDGLSVDKVAALRADLSALSPQLRASQPAEEYGDDALNVRKRLDDAVRGLARVDEARDIRRAADVASDLTPVIDFLLGEVLASWAYAPHLGEADGPGLIGGDVSARHRFGVRLVGAGKKAARWQVAMSGEDGGTVEGALLGLDAALAKWSLRRLAADSVPPEPTINSNDLSTFLLTVALSNPRRLTDEARDRIAAATAAGTAALQAANRDAAALDAAAAKAAMSPWRRQALSWNVAEDPDQLDGWFSAAERAWLGGLSPADVDPWGTASIPQGCLCLRMPRLIVPEAMVGRWTEGLMAARSPDLMLRIAVLLAELKMPASLARDVLTYSMRDFLDTVRPAHAGDLGAFTSQAARLSRQIVEDYLGALTAIGPLRPLSPEEH